MDLKYGMDNTILSFVDINDVPGLNDSPDDSWESLGIIAARMSSEAIETHDQVTYFAIDVFPDDATPPWRVLRRYNDFLLLALSLGVYHLPGAPFPRKHFTGCAGAKLERRRESLDNWIAQAISFAKETRSVSYLHGFLGAPPDRSQSLHELVMHYELPIDTKWPAFIVPSTMSFHGLGPSPEEDGHSQACHQMHDKVSARTASFVLKLQDCIGLGLV